MGSDPSKNIELITEIPLSGQVNRKELASWVLYKAEIFENNKSDVENVSIFDYVDDVNSRDNSLLVLKSIRHPNVIQLHKYHSVQKYSQHIDSCYLVTEPVVPLINIINILNIHEILAGIYDVLCAMHFLHNTANISHNSLNILSIFVGLDHSWKLGRFEKASIHDGGTPAGKDKHNKVFKSDGDGLIELIDELAEIESDNLNESDIEILKSISEEMKQDKCNTISTETTTNHDYLDIANYYNKNGIVKKSEFVHILTFLKSIVLKTKEEKEEFFKSLTTKLSTLPEELITKRLLTLLTQRFVFLDETACSQFIPQLLVPKTNLSSDECLLSEESFRTSLVPLLLRIFTIRETSVRLVLLENFKSYCRYISEEDLKSFVLNEVLLSSRESDDILVEYSLKALSHLVPILGGDVVVGPNRTKWFFDGNIKKSSYHHPPSIESNKHPDVSTNLQEILCKVKIDANHSNDLKHEPLKPTNHRQQTQNNDQPNLNLHDPNINPPPYDLVKSTTESISTPDRSTPIYIHDNIPLNVIDSNSNQDTDKFPFKQLQRPVAIIEPKTTYHRPSSEDLSHLSKVYDDQDVNNESNIITDAPINEIKDNFKESETEHKSLSSKDTVNITDNKKPTLSKKPSKKKGAMRLQPSTQKHSTETDEPQSPTHNPRQTLNEDHNKTLKEQSQLDQAQNDNPSVWNDVWEPIDQNVTQMDQTALKKPQSIQGNHCKTIANQTKNSGYVGIRQSIDQPLGFGYDIKMVEIKKMSNSEISNNDDDIFSELTPDINFQRMTIVKDLARNTITSTATVPATYSSAVNTTTSNATNSATTNVSNITDSSTGIDGNYINTNNDINHSNIPSKMNYLMQGPNNNDAGDGWDDWDAEDKDILL